MCLFSQSSNFRQLTKRPLLCQASFSLSGEDGNIRENNKVMGKPRAFGAENQDKCGYINVTTMNAAAYGLQDCFSRNNLADGLLSRGLFHTNGQPPYPRLWCA
jgi:hypothetical protein